MNTYEDQSAWHTRLPDKWFLVGTCSAIRLPGLQISVELMASSSVRAAAGGVTAVEMKGRIGIGEGNTILRETIQQLVLDGHRKILLVMRDVDHIDSSGIGELVRAHTLARKSSGQMKIAEPRRTYTSCCILPF